MLTEKEIKLIKKNWKSLQGINPVLIGDVFYRKLFIDFPQAKRMFKISREEQAAKLIDMLNTIIVRLQRINELTDDITQMAKRHVEYGVKDEHYQYVGNALIWTLKQASRDEWNEELENAWIKCYTFLADTMIKASK